MVGYSHLVTTSAAGYEPHTHGSEDDDDLISMLFSPSPSSASSSSSSSSWFHPRTSPTSTAFILTKKEYQGISKPILDEGDGILVPKRQYAAQKKRLVKMQQNARKPALLQPRGPWTVAGDEEKPLMLRFSEHPPAEATSSRHDEAEKRAQLRDEVDVPNDESSRVVVNEQLENWKSDTQRSEELERWVHEEEHPENAYEEAKAEKEDWFPHSPGLDQEMQDVPVSMLYSFRAHQLKEKAKLASKLADNAVLEAKKQEQLAHYWRQETLKAESEAMRALTTELKHSDQSQNQGPSGTPGDAAGPETGEGKQITYPLTPEQLGEVGWLPTVPGTELPPTPLVGDYDKGMVRVTSASLLPWSASTPTAASLASSLAATLASTTLTARCREASNAESGSWLRLVSCRPEAQGALPRTRSELLALHGCRQHRLSNFF